MHKIFRTGMAIAVSGAAMFASLAHAEEFNANTYMPDSHPLGKLGHIDFAEDVSKRSDGAIDFKVFTGGALVPPRASLSAIGDNIAQVGFFAGTYTPKELPVANLVASLALANTDMFVQLMASTEFSLTNEAQLAEWKDNNIVFGGGYSTPPYNLICSVKVETLDDIQGKKLRMPGGVYERWAKYVGAVSVNVSSNEMYTGLEKGALDCAGNSNDALRSHSLWEVADYVTLVQAGVYYSGAMYGYNPQFWAGLTTDQRQLLFDAMADHMVRTAVGYKQQHDEDLEWAEGKGIKVLEPGEDLQAKTEEFIRQDREQLIEGAEEAGNIENPAAIVEAYQGLLDKWEGLLEGVDMSDEEALAALIRNEIYAQVDAASYGLN